jgi:hypothetical protein
MMALDDDGDCFVVLPKKDFLAMTHSNQKSKGGAGHGIQR